jgi:hypothetical protein
MSLKGDCKLPNIWVPGTVSPYTKGYCTTQADPITQRDWRFGKFTNTLFR